LDQTNLAGGLVALLSAFVWGTGDFFGGVATRRSSEFQVLALASVSGLVGLLLAMWAAGETWPGPRSLALSAAAGLSGAIGIAALYRGLAIGQAALVAPTATLIGVAVPVIVEGLLHGAPAPVRLTGMAAGVVGIWLVTAGAGGSRDLDGLGSAVLAGMGFGGFFLLIAGTDPGSTFAPLVVSKTAAVLLALGVLLARREGFPSVHDRRLPLVAGLFDAAGNALFLAAARLTRVELAAVISSMAPAVTVLLAAVVSRQRVSIRQKLGVGICLAAIALIVV
jgi:drug/metabolite transporter (DMT)-like permease